MTNYSIPQTLSGYDMILQISQSEINNQFFRMFGSFIHSAVVANDVTAGGFGTGTETLNSYLRAGIDAPVVTLIDADKPQASIFSFNFTTAVVTTDNVPATAAQVAAAFSGDGLDTLLQNAENVSYTDSNGNPQVLTGCPIYYWLTRSDTGPTPTYSVRPALHFTSNGATGMVDLTGLNVCLDIELSKVPQTAAALQAAVDAGDVPPAMSTAIQNGNFDSNAFNLEQLFLDFDTVDFSQWKSDQWTGPDTISLVIFDGAGNYTFSSATRSTFLDGNADFDSDFENNLRLAFGESTHSDNPAASPYTISVTPLAAPDNDPAPSLEPTQLSVTTLAGLSADLNAVTYQVMGGSGTLPSQASTVNYLTGTDFSGELLYSRQAFFESVIVEQWAQSLSAAFAETDGINWTPWSADDSGTSASFSTPSRPVNDVPSALGRAERSSTGQFRATVDVGQGTVQLTATITCTVVIYYLDTKYTATTTGTGQWSDTVSIAVSPQANTLIAQPALPNQSFEVADTQYNTGLSIVLKALDRILTLLGGPNGVMQDQAIEWNIMRGLQDMSFDLGSAGMSLAMTRFIPPTGSTLLCNAPRFTDDLVLQMDVTYDV